MTDAIELLRRMYRGFNERDLDGVLSCVTDDVMWANGMDGGHVHGKEAIRAYWSRQWTIVSPHVEPIHFEASADKSIVVKVQQTLRDLDGNLLTAQSHVLRNDLVEHVFTLVNGRVSRFDIGG